MPVQAWLDRGLDVLMQVLGCSDASSHMLWCRSVDAVMQVHGCCDAGPQMLRCSSPDVQIRETETLLGKERERRLALNNRSFLEQKFSLQGILSKHFIILAQWPKTIKVRSLYFLQLLNCHKIKSLIFLILSSRLRCWRFVALTNYRYLADIISKEIHCSRKLAPSFLK